MNRVVFLNALPLNAIYAKDFTITVSKADVELMRKWIEFYKKYKFEFKCFIRHKSTVELLNKEFELMLEPSSDVYHYENNDRLIIVTLKNVQRGKEVEVKDINDLEFYHVTINVW